MLLKFILPPDLKIRDQLCSEKSEYVFDGFHSDFTYSDPLQSDPKTCYFFKWRNGNFFIHPHSWISSLTRLKIENQTRKMKIMLPILSADKQCFIYYFWHIFFLNKTLIHFRNYFNLFIQWLRNAQTSPPPPPHSLFMLFSLQRHSEFTYLGI